MVPKHAARAGKSTAGRNCRMDKGLYLSFVAVAAVLALFPQFLTPGMPSVDAVRAAA